MRTQRATRQVLAVMVVATALCADRVAQAAPAIRPQTVRTEPQVPQVVQLAGRLVNSLSRRFRQVVPAALLDETCQPTTDQRRPQSILPDQSLAVVLPLLSPFQFRLPPPIV